MVQIKYYKFHDVNHTYYILNYLFQDLYRENKKFNEIWVSAKNIWNMCALFI
jgi:hypothetical protein